MLFSLHSPDQTKIEDKTVNVSEYFEQKGLTVYKLLLFSKPFKFSIDSLSSDDDFEDFQIDFKERPEQIDSNYIEIENSMFKPGETTTSTSKVTSTPKVEDRLQVIKEQNEKFELSLRADKLKDQLKQNKMEENKRIERMEKEKNEAHRVHLKTVQEKRAQHVPLEPSLSQPCCVITVIHLSMGRKTRLFSSHSKMEDVYNWIGSLCEEPELFELEYGVLLQVIDPNESITSYEKHLLYMREVQNSNSTIDIQIPQCSGVNAPKRCILCPICSIEVSCDQIETHADNCAKESFPVIIESDSDESMPEEDLPVVSLEREVPGHNIIETLKSLIDTCQIDKRSALKLRIRRNFVFQDFCEKMSLSWTQRRLGSIFYVQFHGETGIDKGGLSREFFSGKLFFFFFFFFFVKSIFKDVFYKL